MKRALSILICFLLIFSCFPITAFADDPEDPAPSSTNGSEYPDAYDPEDELDAEETQFEDENDLVNEPEDMETLLSVEEKAALLNSSQLSPLVTGYQPLDTLVGQILSEILTDEMSTYDKVRAIYSYIMTDTLYQNDNTTTDALYSTIRREVPYLYARDRNIVCEAYGFLVEGYGVCNHFSSAFLVLTRAVGLETYDVFCTNSTFGAGDHVGTVIRLNGSFYLFDPVMDNVLKRTEPVETSDYFCARYLNTPSREYCLGEELVSDFGNFITSDQLPVTIKETVNGTTVGDVHFTFGSYPQSLVTDEALLSSLNDLLNPDDMISYSYYSGTGEIGSQQESDYMRYADITFEGEKYRAVTFSSYRPKITYYTCDAMNSLQYRSNYHPDTVYWFRYEPIEWRLTDGENLLLADLSLDAQPFNTGLYTVEGGKEIDGVTYYAFSDADCTIPANKWETSSIRQWLNDDFYNTAFSEYEKSLFYDSEITNIGYNGVYVYENTTDKVFLMSRAEVKDSGYFLSQDRPSRMAMSTDYAKCQGTTNKQLGMNHYSSWLLRTPGYHTEDVCSISDNGLVGTHMKTAATMNGIRPAIRINIAQLIEDTPLSVPAKVTATATATGQITVSSYPCNGSDGYRFYLYTEGSDTPIQVFSQDSPTLVIDDLTPGETYVIRASAFRLIGGEQVESELSDSAEVLCRTVVNHPESIESESVKTGEIRLTYSAVENAVEYRIYKYISNVALTYCASSDSTTCIISGLNAGSKYNFRVSAVSPDGYESPMSKAHTICECISYPERVKNLSAQAVSTGCLTLSWDPVEDADLYRVFRYAGNNTYNEIAAVNDTTYTVEGLPLGVLYYFYVVAETADGEDVSAPMYVHEECVSIPPVPQDGYTTADKTGEITLHWSASEGAASYHVFRFAGDGVYNEIDTTAQTSYTVTGLSPGVTYYFYITAEAQNGVDISAPLYLNSECKSIPAIPTGLSGVSTDVGSVTLSWNGVEDAVYYNIYRYVSATETELVAITHETSFTETGLAGGKGYTYRISSMTADGEHESAFTPSVRVDCIGLPAVTGLTGSSDYPGQLTLSWNASEGASQYFVYRFVTAATAEKIAAVRTAEFTETGLEAGKSYTYYVTAANADGTTESVRTDYLKVTAGAIPAPADLTAVPITTDSIRLSWSPAYFDGASYIVERYLSGGEYTQVAETNGTSCLVSGLSVGTNYRFRVKVRTADGLYESAYANVASTCISIPAVPTGLVGESTEIGCVTLHWDAVPDAAFYKVYRYISASDTLYLASVESNEFTETGLMGGKSYSYRICAVTDDQSSTSLFTATVKVDCMGLDTPTGLTGSSDYPGQLTLRWNAAEGASQYYVYKFMTATTAEIVDTVITEEYTETGLEAGKSYTYYIVAANADGTTKSPRTDYLKVTAGSIPAPADLTSTPYTTDSIKLSWTPAYFDGAVYVVEKYVSGGEYIQLTETGETSYVVSNLSAGSNYRFRVKVRTADSLYESTYSVISAGCESIPAVPANVIASTSNYPFAVSLIWDEVPDATGYEIYRYLGADVGYAVIGESETPYFEARGLRIGVNYSFRIAAVRQDDTIRHVSKLSEAVTASTYKPAAPEEFSAFASESSQITLQWSECYGVDRYDIYCYDKDEKAYLKIGSTADLTYTVRDLTPSTSYSFKVEPVVVCDENELSGTRSTAVSCRAIGGPAAPENFAYELQNNHVLLSWNAVSGVSRYDIYYSTDDGESYSLFASTEATSFEEDNLLYDTPYRFKVAAVNVIDNVSFTGAFTDDQAFLIPYREELFDNCVTIYSASVTYNGKLRTPYVTVKNQNDEKLTEGTDYTVDVPEGRTEVGEYLYIITGIGGYTGTVEKTFTIAPQPLKAANVTLYSETVVYNGKVRTPSITVKNTAGQVLTKGVDYTVTAPAGRNAVGEYIYTITGIGNYSGTVQKTFTVTPQALKAANVTLYSASVVYNGKVRTPSVIVKNTAGQVLTKDVDYTVSVPEGRTNAGRYVYTITGIGNYMSTVSKVFTVSPQTLKASDISLYSASVIYNGKLRTPSVTVKNTAGQILTKDVDYTVEVPGGRTEVGTYIYRITGIGNYSGTVEKEFVIRPKNREELLSENVSLYSATVTYNGNQRTPRVTVLNAAGTKLTEGKDYTVQVPEGRTDVGEYPYVITGIGNYSGTVTKIFTIRER